MYYPLEYYNYMTHNNYKSVDYVSISKISIITEIHLNTPLPMNFYQHNIINC